ncbi:SPOR domain-containing protein [Antarcticibacterium arcticum]|uniref:SPOR domain-containing protein n=1 Tax=Antarcticibacterium arcticum TaxID=2585771 RepID=A0A5B8YKD5_9FLAO|nr:SPOR domain-containing protein [Antarcticibacterium arcticum]QED38111.1 SPOR domain-containing protein [Antarcticibacterium arcticum]
MRILNIQNCIISGIFILGLHLSGSAQTGQVNIQQDPIIPQLLEQKTDLTKKGRFGERFNIQLFNGDNNAASEVLKTVRQKYSDWPSDIIYETPNYKVLMGNFRNRLEADRVLLQIKQDYPAAFIPKPRRG